MFAELLPRKLLLNLKYVDVASCMLKWDHIIALEHWSLKCNENLAQGDQMDSVQGNK